MDKRPLLHLYMDPFHQHILRQLPELSADELAQFTSAFTLRQIKKGQFIVQPGLTLAPQEALILRLKYQEGLDVQQIGDKLHLKNSAVKMRLKRARDRVRHLCGDSLLQL